MSQIKMERSTILQRTPRSYGIRQPRRCGETCAGSLQTTMGGLIKIRPYNELLKRSRFSVSLVRLTVVIRRHSRHEDGQSSWFNFAGFVIVEPVRHGNIPSV